MAIDDKVVICLPGILARSEEQHKPLWLERYLEVEYVEYGRQSFEPDPIVGQTTTLAKKYTRAGRKVVLLGSSLGGNIAALAAQQLLRDETDVSGRLKVILADAPAGSRTFGAAQAIPPGLITSPAGKMIFSAIGSSMLFISRQGPGLPKDEEITRPGDPEVRSHMGFTSGSSEEEWQKWIKEEAKRCLTGHSGKVWAEQIRWMTEVFENGSLDKAARDLRDIDAVYLQYVVGNGVITQPAAQQWWLERIGHTNDDGSRRWRTIRAPHVSYLQMQPESEAAIVPLIND